MQCEECGVPLWLAGAVLPAGLYMRVDDKAHAVVALDQVGQLPTLLDGHAALYHADAATYTCVTRDCHGSPPVVESRQSDGVCG